MAKPELVRRGMYDCCDGKTVVEVISQDPDSGQIHLIVYDEPDVTKRFDIISTTMFVRLFHPKPVIEYVTGKAPYEPK